MIKIILAGTPEFPIPIFEKIINNSHFKVISIITQPDKPNKRKKKIIFSPVKNLALKYNIKLFQPNNINDISCELKLFEYDILLTCAYGQFLSKEILEIAKIASLNIHASLLPKLRGGAPIHHSIINGATETGITLMYMVKKMDAGDILFQNKVMIEKYDNFGTVHDKLSKLATEKIESWLNNVYSNNITPIKQSTFKKISFGLNIKKSDRILDWNKNAITLNNQIRGLFPWPIAIAKYNETWFKITKSSIVLNNKFNTVTIPGTICDINDIGILVKVKGSEMILIEELVWPNKSKMKVKDFIKGNRIFCIGDILK